MQVTRLCERTGGNGVLPKPSIQFLEPQSAGLVEVHQDDNVEVVEIQPVAVDPQERCCHGHRDAFVPIHERMVLCDPVLAEVVRSVVEA